ncbi:hypothetical protein Z517_09971 [Fonsecaea pedrosoi CBS 271.37]|uniref:Unplaced genomic scaffold supercont1.6, whole genome shotgun sequence n=1 Tax=Fonsecaea pedrosoi CBS 271.37 TaxID=1442368 RepID=A0A0D2GG57_9EURO|nr:uncharacterized protein Z517_09971 [Fonsecaea pedrosoi CBS 271.37]KIW77525.1 hypothetical protein Z517_09971 [Fonsecaea pedrosoi CBS 271.37]
MSSANVTQFVNTLREQTRRFIAELPDRSFKLPEIPPMITDDEDLVVANLRLVLRYLKQVNKLCKRQAATDSSMKVLQHRALVKQFHDVGDWSAKLPPPFETPEAVKEVPRQTPAEERLKRLMSIPWPTKHPSTPTPTQSASTSLPLPGAGGCNNETPGSPVHSEEVGASERKTVARDTIQNEPDATSRIDNNMPSENCAKADASIDAGIALKFQGTDSDIAKADSPPPQPPSELRSFRFRHASDPLQVKTSEIDNYAHQKNRAVSLPVKCEDPMQSCFLRWSGETLEEFIRGVEVDDAKHVNKQRWLFLIQQPDAVAFLGRWPSPAQLKDFMQMYRLEWVVRVRGKWDWEPKPVAVQESVDCYANSVEEFPADRDVVSSVDQAAVDQDGVESSKVADTAECNDDNSVISPAEPSQDSTKDTSNDEQPVLDTPKINGSPSEDVVTDTTANDADSSAVDPATSVQDAPKDTPNDEQPTCDDSDVNELPSEVLGTEDLTENNKEINESPSEDIVADTTESDGEASACDHNTLVQDAPKDTPDDEHSVPDDFDMNESPLEDPVAEEPTTGNCNENHDENNEINDGQPVLGNSDVTESTSEDLVTEKTPESNDEINDEKIEMNDEQLVLDKSDTIESMSENLAAEEPAENNKEISDEKSDINDEQPVLDESDTFESPPEDTIAKEFTENRNEINDEQPALDDIDTNESTSDHHVAEKPSVSNDEINEINDKQPVLDSSYINECSSEDLVTEEPTEKTTENIVCSPVALAQDITKDVSIEEQPALDDSGTSESTPEEVIVEEPTENDGENSVIYLGALVQDATKDISPNNQPALHNSDMNEHTPEDPVVEAAIEDNYENNVFSPVALVQDSTKDSYYEQPTIDISQTNMFASDDLIAAKPADAVADSPPWSTTAIITGVAASAITACTFCPPLCVMMLYVGISYARAKLWQ